MTKISYVIQHDRMGYFNPTDAASDKWSDADFSKDSDKAKTYSVHKNCISRAFQLARQFGADGFTIVELHTTVASTTDVGENIDRVLDAKLQYVRHCEALSDDDFNGMSDRQYREYNDSRMLLRVWGKL